MAVGQKSACGQRPWFCTSHPVDIQRLIHTALAWNFLEGLQNIRISVFLRTCLQGIFGRVLGFRVFQGFDGLLKKGNIYV
jgi:hypothetical protein